ncbi:fam-l protein [Plasmodium malariae]|uniref:Fam-l protein n=1 Tax=Plasmodium malariae TaxID=5858 RepID=A0A1D3JJY4_PLAMA|nr:fam-l protein [Plasmodium malariae]SBT86819.1 fam-l protein [Plasmodium malariae]
MEQNIALFLFINISTYILLPWICYFYNDMSPLNIYFEEKCNFIRKLNTRNYRLLTKHKHDKDSCIAKFKEETPNNEVKEKRYKSNNKRGTDGKHKQSCRRSLYIKEYDRNVEKNKCVIPKTKKYFDFERKIFKELDYEDYVKNSKIIEYKEYKKLARKKCRIRIALLLLFIFILILPILDLSLEKLVSGGLLGLLHLLYPSPTDAQIAPGVDGLLNTLLSKEGWGNLQKIFASTTFIYGVPFLIFVVIFVLVMIYYYKKVIKYENIKFRKRSNKK